MYSLDVEFDEGIVLKTEGVYRSEEGKSIPINKMILTTKNIYYITKQKTGGFFSKSMDVEKKIPLSEVKVINGKAFVSCIRKDLFVYALHIQFISHTDEYLFSEKSRKIANQWVNEIKRLLENDQNGNLLKSKKERNNYEEASGASSSSEDLISRNNRESLYSIEEHNSALEYTKTRHEIKRRRRAQEDSLYHREILSQADQNLPGNYCKNCGKRIDEFTNFCPDCGTEVGQLSVDEHIPSYTKISYPKEREIEYAGKIIKCPSCGTEIPSLTAFCPGCGHEINSAIVSATIRDFTHKIIKYDQMIELNNRRVNTGWKSWSTLKKIGWVIFNVYTICIPLVIYLLLNRLGLRGRSSLSPEEKRKVQFINNYVFPNDRESILEGLIYIKTQMRLLSSEKIDRNTFFWIKTWKNKATQLFERAEMMFKGDKIANETYVEIIKYEKKVKNQLSIRLIAAIALALLLPVSIIMLGRSPEQPPKAKTTPISENEQSNESKGIYTYNIRNYVGKNLASVGKLQNDTLVDEYGHGEIRIIIVAEDGRYIPVDSEDKKSYVVVAQNIDAGKEITLVHEIDSQGEPYPYFVEYQSYDEMVIYVAPIGKKDYVPQITEILPTLDKHIYHIRDYCGRNAASFGKKSTSNRIDEYGNGEIRFTYTSESGEYVDTDDLNELQKYYVIKQDVEPNTELKLVYEKDRYGEEYDSLILSQNYEEINLTVKKRDDSIFSKFLNLF